MEVDESQSAGVKTIQAPTTERGEYEELCQLVNPISKPLADRRLAKKVYKLVKKSAQQKGFMKHGLADVMKAFRKNEKGIVILAVLALIRQLTKSRMNVRIRVIWSSTFQGNVSPIDVYSHVPAMCEEKGLPYVYTPSREHLGLCAGYKRPAIVLLVKKHEAYEELFDQTYECVNALVVEPE